MALATPELEPGMPSGHHWEAERRAGTVGGRGPELLVFVLHSEASDSTFPAALDSQDRKLEGRWGQKHQALTLSGKAWGPWRGVKWLIHRIGCPPGNHRVGEGCAVSVFLFVYLAFIEHLLLATHRAMRALG